MHGLIISPRPFRKENLDRKGQDNSPNGVNVPIAQGENINYRKSYTPVANQLHWLA